MAQAKSGDTVKVHYTGKLDDGTEFDSSVEDSPLEFTLGEGELIPGFEEAVIGMSPGESKTVRIASAQAYGPHQEEMVLVVEHDQFPPHITPHLGQQLELRHPDGQAVSVTVTEVSPIGITLDANHPLAGQDLIFDIELVDIA
jgi:peptidylprolyl isomerase